MKKIIAISLLGLLATTVALAQIEGTITMSGTTEAVLTMVVKVNDTTPAEINWGTFNTGDRISTFNKGDYTLLSPHQHPTIIVGGDVTADLSIRGTDATGAAIWELAETAGADQYALHVGIGESEWLATGINEDTFMSLGSQGTNVFGNIVIDFALDVATSSSGFGSESFSTTILATAH